MQSQDKINQHAALVDHMAQALGLDLDQFTMQGRLAPEDLSDAVLRCTGCSSPKDCQTWLNEQDTPQPSPPAYCRNQRLFEELAGPQAD